MRSGPSDAKSRSCSIAGSSSLLPMRNVCSLATWRLFPSDMERQHLKLMDMIAAIVGALDEHELFQSIIRHTGRQHADLGVKRSHFDAFGDALIWCLEHQFGAAFPPELREAWMTLYDAERSRSPVGEPNRWRARAVDHIDRLPSGIRWRHFYPRRRRVAVALAR